MIAVTAELVAALQEAGVECHLQGGTIPLNTTLEPPCSVTSMSAVHSLFIKI